MRNSGTVLKEQKLLIIDKAFSNIYSMAHNSMQTLVCNRTITDETTNKMTHVSTIIHYMV